MSSVVIDGVEWTVEGAQVAIVERGRVLLQFRPWPPGWELPGGHCEPGEDPAVTAERETEEETGYRVRIAGVVGVYSWRGLRSAGDVVFLGEVVGGAPRRSLEAWALRMARPDHLPRTVFPWIRERAQDAVDVAGGGAAVHRVQPVTIRHVLGFATAWLHTPYPHQELLLREALGLGDKPTHTAAGPMMVGGLERFASAAKAIAAGEVSKALAHATSGPCLQQNLVCVMEGD